MGKMESVKNSPKWRENGPNKFLECLTQEFNLTVEPETGGVWGGRLILTGLIGEKVTSPLK